MFFLALLHLDLAKEEFFQEAEGAVKWFIPPVLPFRKRNGHKRCRVDLERVNTRLFNPTTTCCVPITTWPPPSVELHLSVPQRHFGFGLFPVSFSIYCWAVVVEGCVTACRGGSLLTSITHLLSSGSKSSSPDAVWGSKRVVRPQMLCSTYSRWSPAGLQVVEGLWALWGCVCILNALR